MTQPESKLTKIILDVLHRAGCYAMRNAQATSRTRGHTGLPKGSADVVAILAPTGRWLCLEVKLPGEKADPHQVAWLDTMRRNGAFCAVVTSPAEALAALQEARKLK